MSARKRKRSFLSRHPRLRHYVYGIYGILAAPLFLLPLPFFLLPKRVVYGGMRVIALRVIHPFIARDAERNLFYAYGDRMTERRARAISRKVAITLGWSILDCYYMWLLFPWFDIEKIVPCVRNRAAVDTVIEEGHGLFIATAHFNCFEIMPVYFARKVTDTGGVIARKIPSPFLTWVNRRARLFHGIPTYYDEVRGVVRALRAGGVVGIVPDLHAKRRLGMESNFYGKPTMTLDVHWRLAAKLETPVIVAMALRHRREPWRYTIEFSAPLRIVKRAGDDDVRVKVQELNDTLEHYIRRHPGSWYWFTNRWRLR